MQQRDWIDAGIGTLDALFRERVRRTPDRIAYRHYDTRARAWRDLTWAEMGERVARWQAALREEGLQPGDRVALQIRNGPHWVAFEQAALGLGLVVVPLYCEDRPDNVTYILQDAGVKVLLVDTAARWDRLAGQGEALEGLRRVFVLQADKGGMDGDDGRLAAVPDRLPAAAPPLRERGGDAGALATIVYTSGTTGRPKGVMLSHRNILSVADASIRALPVTGDDVALSFLPISHTFERTTGYYIPMMLGMTVVYARSVQQLAEDIATQRPTALVSVPRIFERIYERLQQQLARGPAIRRLLFNLAVAVGWRRFRHRQGLAGWHPALVLWPLLHRLVAAKIHARLGGRLRLAVSGGAALPLPVARVFLGLGVNLIQGYGLTETSPVISTNRLDDNDPASVGRPLEGIEVRTDPETGELLVKGPGVMLGYWNNHRATAEMIDPDGWLHTGDKAEIRDGRIYITGRIKDILVLSNGEKIPPVDMEAAITLDPLFEQAVVVGEGRPYLGALVVLNADHWFGLAQEHGLDPFDEEALRHPRLLKTLTARVADCLHDFPGYAKIRRVAPLLQPWTIDNGMLTPTLKVKRHKVMEAHAALVEDLYA